MYSLTYANTLVPEDLTQMEAPAILVIHALEGIPDTPDLPRRVVTVTPPLHVGRDARCEVRIQDKFLSRIHATITQPAPKSPYWIHDGDGRGRTSANGIFLNLQRLEAAQELQDMDGIYFGINVRATFHVVRQPGSSDHLEHLPLKELLQEAGLISSVQIATAMRLKDQSNMTLGDAILSKGWLQPLTIEFMLKIDYTKLAIPSGRSPIGEYLKLAGLITENQIQQALQAVRRHRIPFGMALVELGYVKEPTLDFFLKRYEHLDASQAQTSHISTTLRS